ncbi:MAG: DUF3303 family protein [Rubripirellula sp.]
MLYMVELKYPEEHRDSALDYFWKHGATHYEGKVTLEGAWVATQDFIAYAVVSTKAVEEVEKACEPLREFGEVSYRKVSSLDQL